MENGNEDISSEEHFDHSILKHKLEIETRRTTKKFKDKYL
jgi:hypothetical protein